MNPSLSVLLIMNKGPVNCMSLLTGPSLNKIHVNIQRQLSCTKTIQNKKSAFTTKYWQREVIFCLKASWCGKVKCSQRSGVSPEDTHILRAQYRRGTNSISGSPSMRERCVLSRQHITSPSHILKVHGCTPLTPAFRSKYTWRTGSVLIKSTEVCTSTEGRVGSGHQRILVYVFECHNGESLTKGKQGLLLLFPFLGLVVPMLQTVPLALLNMCCLLSL